MTDPATPLDLRRCEVCHLRFLPTDGPCPRCGAVEVSPYPVPDDGQVIAATELSATAPGWHSPHRLALLEVADGVRVLAVVAGPLPRIGERLRVRKSGEIYTAEAPPITP